MVVHITGVGPPLCGKLSVLSLLSRMVVLPVTIRQQQTNSPFSALSVEPYGGSVAGVVIDVRIEAFSALSVEPYGGSPPGTRARYQLGHFQCSLC